jgi:high-affinity iron transporter
MRIRLRDALATTAVAAAVSAALAAQAPAPSHQAGARQSSGARRRADPATLKNPIAADAASLADGKTVYERNCAGCHGDSGKGDGTMGEELNPRPANLVDADWKHGSTDGEIFSVIRDGVKTTGMKPYARKLTTRQIWDVVNYLRSIGPH